MGLPLIFAINGIVALKRTVYIRSEPRLNPFRGLFDKSQRGSLREEEMMEKTIKEQKENTVKEEKKGKRKWLSHFLNFLMYGGWLLVIVVILGIIILISVLSK